MNMFQSNSAPFLLALIVSALGWYVGEISQDLRNTKIATYRLDADEKAPHAKVMIQNVSRTQSLDNITFALVCPRAPSGDKASNRGKLITRPPIAPINEVLNPDQAGEMSVNTSLAPGGAIGLEATLADCPASPLKFYYRPSGPDRFLLVERDSIEGRLARKYVDLLLILFFVFSLVFLAWMVISITFWWRRRHDPAPADTIYRVRLSFDDSGSLGTAPPNQNQPDG
jgi:hypothetical protein